MQDITFIDNNIRNKIALVLTSGLRPPRSAPIGLEYFGETARAPFKSPREEEEEVLSDEQFSKGLICLTHEPANGKA